MLIIKGDFLWIYIIIGVHMLFCILLDLWLNYNSYRNDEKHWFWKTRDCLLKALSSIYLYHPFRCCPCLFTQNLSLRYPDLTLLRPYYNAKRTREILISNIHLLSPQKWSQFVHFNIEKVFPRGQP